MSNGMFPEMRTTEPNSPTAFPNESAAPERIAGHQVREDDPPERRERARAERRRRLLHLAVELEEDRLHRADDEGKRDEERARATIAARV